MRYSHESTRHLPNGETMRYRFEDRHDGAYAVRLDNGLTQRVYAKDSQRERCYSLERSMRYNNQHMCERVTIQEAQAIADQVCADYEVSPVTVKMAPPRQRTSWYERWTSTIKLLDSGLTKGTVYHEIAHHIAFELASVDFPVSIVGHGPEFMTVAFDMYAHYLGVDVEPYRSYKKGTKGLQFADQWTHRKRPGVTSDPVEEMLMKQVGAARVALQEAERALAAHLRTK